MAENPTDAQILALRRDLQDYVDAIGNSAEATAIAFVRISGSQGQSAYGVGLNSNIDQSAVEAIVSALNRLD